MSNPNTQNKDEKTASTSSNLIPVFIMGKRYDVPESLTIMKAMEYAGYKYIRGCGCRGGICGACATVYRKPGDYHIRVGLACQTVVEPDMYLTQIPFFPANRAAYDIKPIDKDPEEVFKKYPELFRCLACNACSKVCPMDIQVMDYISAIKQGEFEKATELSFDCIQCGLCASRCMAEMAQYHIAQMVRRITGSKIKPRAKHLNDVVSKIEKGKYDNIFKELKALDVNTLKKLYTEREMEPAATPEDWSPQKKDYL
ncbi:MAG: 4Fe-4S dicluster domain-containing protein [Thermodesulfobacteriota bacterium]|nr:4Fe-4S dicluster domain-containing protein [Thermodesulfobacteriota bacterium]